MKLFDFPKFFLFCVVSGALSTPLYSQPKNTLVARLPQPRKTSDAVSAELKAAEHALQDSVPLPAETAPERKFLEIPGEEAPPPCAIAENCTPCSKGDSKLPRSLQETLEKAYMQNAELDAARAGLRVKVETLSQAYADWRPSLSVVGRQTNELRYPLGKLPQQDPSNRSGNNTSHIKWHEFRTDYDAQLKQNIFKGGATVAKIGEEESNVSAGKYELGALEQKTLFDATHAHTEIIAREAILKNQLATQAFNKTRYEYARAAFEVGQGSRADVEIASSEYNQATADVAVAEGRLETAIAAYEYQVGVLPGVLKPANILLDIPRTCLEAQQIAQTQNPTIIAAKYALEAAEYNVNLQIAGLLPTIDVNGNVGNDVRGGTSYPFPFNNRAQTNLGFNATMNVPLYLQGIPNSKVRQAYQILAQQKVKLINSQRKVREDVKAAWATFKAAEKSLKSFIAQVKALEVALEGIVEEYKIGIKSIVDVFVERDKLTQAQNRLAEAQQKLVDSTYALLQTTGRLTACCLKLRVQYYDPDVYYKEYRRAWIQFWQSDDMSYVKEATPK